MRKRLITMISNRMLRTSALGVLFLFSTLSPLHAIPNVQQIAILLGLKCRPIAALNIVNDMEDDLEYILQVESVRELTDSLTVHANGIKLTPDTITSIPLNSMSCTFSFEFPLAAFLKLLEQEKMQTLVTTYKEHIEAYIQRKVRPCFQKFYANYSDTRLFKAMLNMLKVRITFAYTVTQEDTKKECIGLLALVLRKKAEISNASELGNAVLSTTYSPLKTISMHIEP